MKRFKLISTILTIIALLLCGWSIFELNTEDGNLVGASLNLAYFATLFISFLCIRISTGISNKIEPVTTLIGIGVITLSTYTWMRSSELLVVGQFTLGLIPLLIGTTLMLLVKSHSIVSKLIQALIGVVAISISSCVFLGISGPSIFAILFFGLIVITLAVLGYSLFVKTT